MNSDFFIQLPLTSIVCLFLFPKHKRSIATERCWASSGVAAHYSVCPGEQFWDLQPALEDVPAQWPVRGGLGGRLGSHSGCELQQHHAVCEGWLPRAVDTSGDRFAYQWRAHGHRCLRHWCARWDLFSFSSTLFITLLYLFSREVFSWLYWWVDTLARILCTVAHMLNAVLYFEICCDRS